ncbi:MAG TPA: hypothetical protein VH413_18450 [Verrucomicrobiae bacterium]|jgi:hypothetical protein|nr:hypothetical protein [Verrucomicrobiae bacterium]
MKQFATMGRGFSLVLGLAATAFLTGCATAPKTYEQAVFKFSVLRYDHPVEVAHWTVDPSQSGNPEGEALNIATAMQHGNFNQWLACWDDAERPKLTGTDRDKLMASWQSLKDGYFKMLGRVVAGSDLIVEISVENPGQKASVLKLPLKHENDQWWLTAMDANSEFLNWEFSPNRTVEKIDTRGIRMYLSQFKEAMR